MALRSTTKPTHTEIPHEPGQWIEYRQLSADELEELQTGEFSSLGYTIHALTKMLTSWSYDGPVNRENIGDLDAQTIRWLDSNLLEMAGIRTEAEKKELITPSSDTTAQAEDDSPPSSST